MTAFPTFALFLVRISFGAFIALWGLNKIVRPEATERLFANFYGLEGLGSQVAAGLGSVQLLVGLAIVVGVLRTISYATGFEIHAVSTLATLPHLIAPLAEGSNLLFWTGVPVLLAAVGLFLLRDADTFLSVDAIRSGASGLATRA